MTAGNSSPLNDGGTALLLASREYAGEHGVTPNAHIRSMAVAAVPPRITGIGPVPAGRKALERDGLTVADMGLNELNEAFAAQTLAALQEWGTGPEAPWANVNGGAIASGHRVGCSGSRLQRTLVHEMARRKAQFGLATMCLVVGQGIAMVVELTD